MRIISVFNSVTLDGYFADVDGDISWAHQDKGQDEAFDAFVSGNANGGGVLLFGRKTYDMMASYWPTPMATQNDPDLAERMNSLQKLVVSRSLSQAPWSNTTLIKGDLVAEIQKLKASPGDPITILGSGSIVAQLTQAGLIDEYQLVVTPVILGRGKTLFEGVKDSLRLQLIRSRTFENGKVWLYYGRRDRP